MSLEWLPPKSQGTAKNICDWQSSGLYSKGMLHQQASNQNQPGPADAADAPLPQHRPGRLGGELINRLQQEPLQSGCSSAPAATQPLANSVQLQAQPPPTNQRHAHQSPFSWQRSDQHEVMPEQLATQRQGQSQQQQKQAQRHYHQQQQQRQQSPFSDNQQSFGHLQPPRQAAAQQAEAPHQDMQAAQSGQLLQQDGSDAEQRRLTFQEILRQQLEAHSHQVV